MINIKALEQLARAAYPMQHGAALKQLLAMRIEAQQKALKAEDALKDAYKDVDDLAALHLALANDADWQEEMRERTSRMHFHWRSDGWNDSSCFDGSGI